MTANRFCAPTARKLSSNKTTIKKLTATSFRLFVFGTTLVLCLPIQRTSSLEPIATVEAETVAVAHSLSRSRCAFTKALEILEDAATANPKLTTYYASVKKRVKGESAFAENNSGIVLSAGKTQASSTGSPTMPSPDSFPEIEMQSPLALTNPSVTGLQLPSPSAPPPPALADTKGSLTAGDIAFERNPAVDYWIEYYTKTAVGRQTMSIGIERSRAYLAMARGEFRKAGVPEDLVWLALVESTWNPRAVSPAAAGGIWQFIRATATDYGLKVQNNNDERSDPLKQTRVAATYLRDLYTLFGDWALAMAAYNSGEPRTMGAIARNGRADFWELCDKELLPKETRNYVPKILAAITVASNADAYGLSSLADMNASSGS
jgi:transglycosylase-like protein with SLT domain